MSRKVWNVEQLRFWRSRTTRALAQAYFVLLTLYSLPQLEWRLFPLFRQTEDDELIVHLDRRGGVRCSRPAVAIGAGGSACRRDNNVLSAVHGVDGGDADGILRK